jgi:hypothetical protein
MGRRPGRKPHPGQRQKVAQTLVRSGLVTSGGSFFDLAEGSVLKARGAAPGDTPRKILYIAPGERHLALCELAAECPGMSEDELVKQACDFFGWRRIGKDIRDCLAADIAQLYRQRRLEGGPGRIGVPATG